MLTLTVCINLILATVGQAFPESLSMTIEDGDEILTINWKYTKQYLANENLPVWFAWKNEQPVFQPHVMSNIGPFRMYHDVEKSSAIVYFKKVNCFFGVVDTRFFIQELPLSELQSEKHHIVDGPYIKRRVGTNHDDLMNFIFDKISSSASLPSRSSHILQSANNGVAHYYHQKANILYPEILVFVPNGIVKRYKTAMAIVAFYLVQMNAVDMLFAKLSEHGVFIHINVAGFVFEAEPDVFPYVYSSEQSRGSKIVDAVATLEEFPKYLKEHDGIFVEDSFDFFFLMTQFNLEFEGRNVDGLTRMDLSMYELRSLRNHLNINYEAVGTIIRDQRDHGNFVSSAHELAHIMKVAHDPVDAGDHCFDIQCYAILQTTASHCKNCIVWSAKSLEEFRSYVSMNKDRCFLLNKPRSLHPYGVPIETIGPYQQCVCYGYESNWSFTHKLDLVNRHACAKRLACASGNRRVHCKNPDPVDGTPCGRNKVCWLKTCQNLV